MNYQVTSRKIMIYKFFLYFNTIKYLKIKQIFYRVLYKLPTNRTPVIPVDLKVNNWRWQGCPYKHQSFYDDDKVVLLNVSEYVKNPEHWNDTTKDKLWLYNLHYFDDLDALESELRINLHQEFISRWIKENPPCFGVGWEPYPLSLRIVNLIKWMSKQKCYDYLLVQSLYLQTEVLSKQLEFHILGNHLFANAKALIFSGCFLKSPHSSRFLNLGLKIIDKQISEQFLQDGAHFELSPMYHSILLWDLLELIDLANVSETPKLLEQLPRWKKFASNALTWLHTMIHPDGEVSFFNDSAIDIAPAPAKIFDYACKLGLTGMQNTNFLTVNRTSGYSRMVVGEFVCLFDHANIGPDYLPGHAHADSLSFELSVGKQRLFVNSGTSLYGISAERLRQRSTSAHNTVVVDSQNSSEVWSGFRVARRAYTTLVDSAVSENGCFVRAYHDGYTRLPGKVQHTRRIDVDEKQVVISDNLQGEFQTAQAHYHLHPNVEVNVVNNSLLLNLPNGESFTLSCSDKVEVIESTWHPRFGESISNKKLLYTLSDDSHRLILRRNN